jgi:hypothetical protein
MSICACSVTSLATGIKLMLFHGLVVSSKMTLSVGLRHGHIVRAFDASVLHQVAFVEEGDQQGHTSWEGAHCAPGVVHKL